MRFFLMVFFIAICSLACAEQAWAIETPTGQVHIDTNQILRGSFIEEHQIKGVNGPLRSVGHFVVAPAYGLIWGTEKPLPTSTIITSNGAAQDIGGIAIKLPSKNIHHLYDIIGRALAGDWSGLETDFILTQSGDLNRWQILLMPRSSDKPKISYATISVSGSRFVENIVMTKVDGSYDTFSFADVVLSSLPLTPSESAVFNEVGQ
jgi:hypothetical protein